MAALSFAFYNIVGHDLLVRRDHWVVLFYTTMSASLLWMVINPPWKIAVAHYSVLDWIFLFLFAMVSGLGPFSFYFAGLKHLEPTTAVVVSCLEPMFSVVIAALALGESLGVRQALGIFLIIAAIVVIQAPDTSSRATPVLGDRN